MLTKCNITGKNLFKIILISSIIITVVSLTSCTLGPDMQHLPKGELINTLNSPNESYTINTYRCNGGATTDYAVRCEVIINKTKESKNIYWNYHQYDADVSWISEDVVEINGHKLNVLTEEYDWRNY